MRAGGIRRAIVFAVATGATSVGMTGATWAAEPSPPMEGPDEGCSCSAPTPPGWENTPEGRSNAALVRLMDSYFARAEARTIHVAERLDAEIAKNKKAVARLLGWPAVWDNFEPTGMYRIQTASSRRADRELIWNTHWRMAQYPHRPTFGI